MTSTPPVSASGEPSVPDAAEEDRGTTTRSRGARSGAGTADAGTKASGTSSATEGRTARGERSTGSAKAPGKEATKAPAKAPATEATTASTTASTTAPAEPGQRRSTRARTGTDAPAARRPTAAATPVRTAPAEPARTTRDTAATESRRVMGYRRQRFEARKVRRLVRHIDPWSMLKLSVMVAVCMWLITMIASVILWTVASNSGTISSIEDFVNSSLQLQDWTLDGEFLFRQFGLISLLLYLGLAASLVVATLVFNLISDIIGGVWISVIEEETARPVNDPPPR